MGIKIRGTEKTKENLDRIEGYNKVNPNRSLYIRRKIEVETDEGKMEEVYVYVFNQEIPKNSSYKRVTSGFWEI